MPKIDDEIRALAFLQLEEILNKQYQLMNGEAHHATNCIINDLRDLTAFLQNFRDSRSDNRTGCIQDAANSLSAPLPAHNQGVIEIQI